MPLGRFFDWLLWLPKNYLFRSPAPVKIFQRIIPQSLFKYKYGDTTYGIGVIPLGGYVKMLGQDDDPAAAAHEMKLLEAQRAAEAVGKSVPEDERVSDERVKELLDPRSYQTKTVPQRMAIITAGVIMNVIFAVIMGVAAYMMGVEKQLAVIGDVLPGGPAWQVGMRPADKVVKIAGEEIKYYEQLRDQVTVKAEYDETGIPFVVERPGVAEPLTFGIEPNTAGGAPDDHGRDGGTR
ncbi:MAG: site-2 protease family protein [Pirellulales bacterium]